MLLLLLARNECVGLGTIPSLGLVSRNCGLLPTTDTRTNLMEMRIETKHGMRCAPNFTLLTYCEICVLLSMSLT